MSGNINDYDLIKLVESFPILYDKSLSRGQRNGAMKDKAWREVSTRLDASERACITRWKSIRDRFGKEYRRVQENPDEPTNWDIFQHLLFLGDHYKHGTGGTEVLTTVKYEPRVKKRKARQSSGNASQVEDDSNNEDDLDANELLISQQLIALVKENPVIYDKQKIRDSKNLTAKNNAWREISESLNISEEVCYNRWKKLRDRFAREYRHQQLHPDTSVTWSYFEDLMFLEAHYRKGVPLCVDTTKRKPATPTNETATDNEPTSYEVWDEVYHYECHEQPFSDSVDQCSDTQTSSMDELVIIAKSKETDEEPVELRKESTPDTDPELEDKLTDIISNLEHILKQAHDCLNALKEQRQRHKLELESNMFCSQSEMMQKILVLLDGFSGSQRNKVERKILRYLCESQIKILNNEELEDICSDECAEL